jgi:hypothetical protein
MLTFFIPILPILSNVMMEAFYSFEASILTKATRRLTSQEGILHSYRRENLKSYITLIGWAL